MGPSIINYYFNQRFQNFCEQKYLKHDYAKRRLHSTARPKFTPNWGFQSGGKPGWGKPADFL